MGVYGSLTVGGTSWRSTISGTTSLSCSEMVSSPGFLGFFFPEKVIELKMVNDWSILVNDGDDCQSLTILTINNTLSY